jgi:hypothetical protein
MDTEKLRELEQEMRSDDGTSVEYYADRLRDILAAQPPKAELWCLHIVGPDDVHAAPSKAHAEKAAAAFNEQFKGSANLMHAEVAPWPHSAESHAEDVEKFIPNWLLPRWQVEGTTTPTAAADSDLVRDAYRHGWINSALWANRSDLIADIGSPAYDKTRDISLAAAVAAKLAKRAIHAQAGGSES